MQIYLKIIKTIKVLIIAFFWAIPCYATTIYFYIPEANINNYVLFKNLFDKYISHYGNYTIQPFSKQNTFEEIVKQKGDGLFIMPSWLFCKLNSEIALVPHLVMVYNNSKTTREILTSNKSMTIENLQKGGIIASSRPQKYVDSLLPSLFRTINKSELRFISVPRDMDALMSVGFGIAQSSIISEDSLEKLNKINPNQYAAVKQLGASKKTLRPLLVSSKKTNIDFNALLNIFEKMNTDTQAVAVRKFLGFDSWQDLNSSEKKFLQTGQLNKKVTM